MMPAMKILIADKFEEVGCTRLAEIGCDVVSEPALTADGLPAALAQHDPDALIVRSTVVSAEAIAAGARLKLVVRAGAGYDTIDVVAASRAGIFVANCPGKNAIAVAELTWALILSCDRRVPDQTRDLRAGQWNKKEYGKARGLFGRTLGVLGMGTIAREVVARARGFGMPVVAWSRSLTAEDAESLGVRHAATPLEVARRADVVTVHVASTAETRSLIDGAFVDAMKPGAYLVNTSRGAVVDEAALRKGIADKGLRAGLDVYAAEPGSGVADWQPELAADPGVYGTHHVGAFNRSGAAGDRPGGGAGDPHLPRHRRSAQLRQPRRAHPGNLHAHGAPPQPAGRAGGGLRRAEQVPHQRRGDGEPDLRRRRDRVRPHPPGPTACCEQARRDSRPER